MLYQFILYAMVLMIGAMMGMACMAMCIISRDADERAERMRKND